MDKKEVYNFYSNAFAMVNTQLVYFYDDMLMSDVRMYLSVALFISDICIKYIIFKCFNNNNNNKISIYVMPHTYNVITVIIIIIYIYYANLNCICAYQHIRTNITKLPVVLCYSLLYIITY
jgi:hypothetical protein